MGGKVEELQHSVKVSVLEALESLNLSPSTILYVQLLGRPEPPRLSFREDNMKVCTKCTNEKCDDDFYIRVDTLNLSAWCKKCIKTSNQTRKVSDWRHRKKIRAVEYKGGKCQRCGYDRCVYALQFHHRDPDTKEFSIASATKWTWAHLKEELDKCDLLCANCHAEVEYS
jgi:hypothetical protein